MRFLLRVLGLEADMVRAEMALIEKERGLQLLENRIRELEAENRALTSLIVEHLREPQHLQPTPASVQTMTPRHLVNAVTSRVQAEDAERLRRRAKELERELGVKEAAGA